MEEAIRLRSDWRPGDLGELVRLHGELYAREHSFDAYVAEGMAKDTVPRQIHNDSPTIGNGAWRRSQ